MAYQTGGHMIVELDDPPYSVNVRVSGGMWHGIELDDLSDRIITVVPGEVIVPILEGDKARPIEVDLYSTIAAQIGLPVKNKCYGHQIMLAFALTDYKLQGRTLPKLLMSINCHSLPDITSFYVFISRVRILNGLRLLQYDYKALVALTELFHDSRLRAWELGYDEGGFWCDELVKAAYKESSIQNTAFQLKKKKEKEARMSKYKAHKQKLANKPVPAVKPMPAVKPARVDNTEPLVDVPSADHISVNPTSPQKDMPQVFYKMDHSRSPSRLVKPNEKRDSRSPVYDSTMRSPPCKKQAGLASKKPVPKRAPSSPSLISPPKKGPSKLLRMFYDVDDDTRLAAHDLEVDSLQWERVNSQRQTPKTKIYL